MTPLSEIEMKCLERVLTVEEAATLLNVTRKRVHDLCKSGKLISRQSAKGRAWLISRTSVEQRIKA